MLTPQHAVAGSGDDPTAGGAARAVERLPLVRCDWLHCCDELAQATGATRVTKPVPYLWYNSGYSPGRRLATYTLRTWGLCGPAHRINYTTVYRKQRSLVSLVLSLRKILSVSFTVRTALDDV